MNKPISILLALLTAMYTSSVLPQGLRPEVASMKPSVADDVRQAAAEAKIQITPFFVNAFVDSASSQEPAFAGMYYSVPKDVRIRRLARYLSAKEGVMADLSTSGDSAKELADFNWGYLAWDSGYAPARLETPKEARLLRVDSAGGTFEYSTFNKKLKPGEFVVLPAMNMTATFELGDKKAFWSGNPTGGVVKLGYASTSRGCEIFVKSTPSSAVVYFNGKEWYERTETSSVRDAGTWDVIVRRDGYKEWREQRRLEAGESWNIDALLTK